MTISHGHGPIRNRAAFPGAASSARPASGKRSRIRSEPCTRPSAVAGSPSPAIEIR